MSKKRGLSLEEKRTKMLEIFFEKKSFFQLKEIEKIAPKEKGITPMSVKEVLQSLVDDNLVDTERIGTSNYFWSYPSKALHKRKRTIETLNEQLNEQKKRKLNNDLKLEEAKKGKIESNERTRALEELAKFQQENEALRAKLAQYAECDPETLKIVGQESAVAMEAANRWTDNLFALKSWCLKKFSIDSKTLDKQFGIPDDFDYLE